MKILVAIASHGHRNDAYLQQLIVEYASMPYDVHVVVVSNEPRELGPDVEVVVGAPTANPWSLPFAHKPIFAERLEQHDLFIYSEDDTLITQDHIEAFLWSSSVLEPDEIAGFLRSERGPDGTLYYSTIHNHYHWDVNSVRWRGGETFAHFTNEHGACYLMTRAQLRRAIASGGFNVPPHEGKYDLLVSAATDPYTQCGFRKLVCISQLPRFTCQHLTNRYIGRTGISAQLLAPQLAALMETEPGSSEAGGAMRVEPRLPSARWIKSYYEPCRDDLIALLPDTVSSVLSIGCGWGRTEQALLERGIAVTAVPLDRVIGRVAAGHGVRVLPCGLQAAPAALAGEQFDALLISGLIHLVDDPVALLSSYRQLLRPDGLAIASFPNLEHASVRWRRWTRTPALEHLGDAERSGIHITSPGLVRRWLDSAGYAMTQLEPQVSGRWRRYHRATLGLLDGLWAGDYAVVARPRLGGMGATGQA